MSHGCVNPIGIAPDLSFLLYKNKSSFAMLFALGCYSYIVPNRELMKECDCMKKVWTYFAIGCVVAIIGMFFSDICGDFFNGMDYGSACVLAHYG